MKKILIFTVVLSLAMAFCLTSCTDTGDTGQSSVSIILSRRSITITDIDTAEPLSATVVGADDENPNITWTSSNEKVAVYENGAVVAKGYGVCIIRAKYNGTSAACTVTVPSPNPELSLNITSLEFTEIGKTLVISALDSSGFNISSVATWSTSNSNVATCRNGAVVAQGYGSCIISAFYKGNSVTCAVEVIDPEAPSLSLSNNDIELLPGATHTLVAIAKNHSAGSIEWRTSDPSVATCNSGVVTAVGEGVCAIVAISSAGVTDACIVKVGTQSPHSYISELLDLSLPKIGEELRFVNKKTGQTVTKILITGYSLHIEPYNGDPYLMLVQLRFIGVKIYDAAGPNATSPVNFKANMYNEYNNLCDYWGFNNGKMIVGDKEDFIVSDFGIQLVDGTHRDFKIVFDEISES